MTGGVLVLSVMMFLGQAAAGAATSGGTKAVEMITIDGSKTPELLPQWAVWEGAFNTLSIAKRHNSAPFIAALNVAEGEKELVFDEALRQAERRKECIEKVEKIVGPIFGKEKPDVVWAKNKALIIEYRQATLDAGARLLKRLSPEGRVGMLAWLERTKAGVTMTVPKGDDFYRLPY